MPISPHIRYRKSLTYAPKLDVPVSLYQRLRHHLHDEVDSFQQPFELCMLAGNAAALLRDSHGRNITFKDVRRLLRETTDFRDRFLKLTNRIIGATGDCAREESQDDVISIVLPYIRHCREDFDAHIKALRHLWFGPTGRVHVNDEWYFDIPANARRQFLARQYAIASLLYVDAAQLAAVQHKNARDTVDFSLRAASALRRAIEFRSLTAQQLRTEMARDAAVKRHHISPKTAAKASVRVRYLNWKANREKHRSAAQFAVAMVNDFEVLESTQTVERWVRDWEKERRTPDKN
ncbi:hypothetical protein PQR14_32230 [Paraburkholderia bryophila]|uniref:hypothetical protein n=1 Tax=Paraburkholderia bryophila TaxID=420952 RepID=UPI0038B8713E